jgi:hypothetical protein
MPVAISVQQFTRQVVDSELMSADAIAAVVDAFPDETRPRDGEHSARVLMRQEKQTAYQARQIHVGEDRPLVLGKLGQERYSATSSGMRGVPRASASEWRLALPQCLRPRDRFHRFAVEISVFPIDSRIADDRLVMEVDVRQVAIQITLDGNDVCQYWRRQLLRPGRSQAGGL